MTIYLYQSLVIFFIAPMSTAGSPSPVPWRGTLLRRPACCCAEDIVDQAPGAYKRRDDEGLGARKSPGKSCKPKGIQYNHYTHTHKSSYKYICIFIHNCICTCKYVILYIYYTSYSNNQSRNSFNRWSLGSNRTLPVASWPAACRTSWTSKTFAAHLGMEKCDPSHSGNILTMAKDN